VELDGLQDAPICRDGLDKATGQDRMVVVARVARSRAHQVLEGVVNERDEAQLAPSRRLGIDGPQDVCHVLSDAALGVPDARGAPSETATQTGIRCGAALEVALRGEPRDQLLDGGRVVAPDVVEHCHASTVDTQHFHDKEPSPVPGIRSAYVSEQALT
jgi:hypothetical protein